MHLLYSDFLILVHFSIELLKDLMFLLFCMSNLPFNCDISIFWFVGVPFWLGLGSFFPLVVSTKGL